MTAARQTMEAAHPLEGGAPDAGAAPSKRTRILLWTAMIVGLTGAGVAFAYKVAEFLFTLGSEEVQGFADVPVTVYFIVASGWLFLLVWCFATGKFSEMERAKLEMLEMEESHDERGE